ncbi:MAG: UDP-N-acetylglucosamine 1-carboxyvinyltransferase [Proteobacteria bacterium]|nr:UDP-N-acetylglucosamine 1-carboxyvinyltransferase [Pseudomonadota bacterium]
MDRIVVEGGRRLKGNVRISGSKNAALPVLVSSLLVDGECVFHNVPDLVDIKSIKLLLEDLGARVETNGDTVMIDASTVHKFEASYDLVRKMRASILVLGPLLARQKKARVSLPGGCAIGARPINLHLKGMENLGATITLEHGYVEAHADALVGNDIYFDVVSVGATENMMMTAVLATGVTLLRNAAREPEITALADVLIQMGAQIEGAGTSVIKITGVTSLKPVEVQIIPDRIEAGTFMVASAMTGGDVTITDCTPDHMGGIIHKLKLSGATVLVNGSSIQVIGSDEIKSLDIQTLPYPGFPTDMQAQFMAMMTVAKGTSVFRETIFENRFIHVSELIRMGADISLSGGNVATVKGVARLSSAPVMASDLRASASLILAGLIAQGTTVVSRVYHLDRGYESLERKFEMLGGAVRREKD